MNKKLLDKIENIIILNDMEIIVFLMYFNFCVKKNPLYYIFFLLIAHNCYSYGFIISDKIQRYNFHITIYYIL